MTTELHKINSLRHINPALAEEWHPTKNGNLKPDIVKPFSNKYVWWKCKFGHEWEATISNRSNGRGCPYCSGRYATKESSLGMSNPELTEEWLSSRNGNLTPFDVKPSLRRKVWWKCKYGHEWKERIADRSAGSGCPYCSGTKIPKDKCLALQKPEMAKQWHPSKNVNLTPFDVTKSSNKRVWWKCEKGHEWAAIINSRKSNACPCCIGRKVCDDNCLANVNSELAKEWHPTRNGNLTPFMVTSGSQKKVWWICNHGHEWQAQVNVRNKGSGCPYCSGRYATQENCLAKRSPQVAKEWHTLKNGELTPFEVTPSSSKKVWWKCNQGHEWKAIIGSRTKGTGCPFCAGKYPSKDYSLSTLKPLLVKEWHPTKNGTLKPEDVTPFSEKKVWWKCNKGHEWQAMISNRAKDRGCPICNDWRQTSFPEQAIFHYTKEIFSDAKNRFIVPGTQLEADVFIPSLRIAIEYDGYYHRYRKKEDEKKNNTFFNNRINLIRLRLDGLPVLENPKCYLINVQNNYDSLRKCILLIFNFIEKNYKLDEIQQNKIKQLSSIDIEKERLKIWSKINHDEKENSLKVKYPHLVKEWHPTKNQGIKPEGVTASSGRKVWWICDKGHEWEAVVSSRTRGIGCPYCSGRFSTEGNCLSIVFPKLAEEWHPFKNNGLTPKMVKPYSNKKVWWQCKEGHEWFMMINRRSNGKQCPYAMVNMQIKQIR